MRKLSEQRERQISTVHFFTIARDCKKNDLLMNRLDFRNSNGSDCSENNWSDHRCHKRQQAALWTVIITILLFQIVWLVLGVMIYRELPLDELSQTLSEARDFFKEVKNFFPPMIRVPTGTPEIVV